VELHGGRVEAFSEGPGKGSEFRVTLPATRAAVVSPQPSAAPEPVESARGKQGLMLIADDNADAAWGLAKLLEIAGYSTLRVYGGRDALKECAQRRPDACVIDIGMPDLNGNEVARQVRQAEWGKRMVLIAATGWGQESDEREAMAAGFDAFMTKPVDQRKLSMLLDQLLAAKRGGERTPLGRRRG
jgi:two-component system CheB/CheR fusion protein